MELAGEIRNEFLTCSICMEGYTMPKQLPCLHTFCKHCLSRYICRTVGSSGNLTVPCPLCRRVARPTNPDPRKLNEWADQFPDNFFVSSLLDTVESRRKEVAGNFGEDEIFDSDSDATSYFMGQVKSCSRHMSECQTHYCLAHKTGICDACQSEHPHDQCSPASHLDSEAARTRATILMQNYRQEMGRVKKEINEVMRSFRSKPRRIQIHKDEVEITVNEYFSKLKVSITKFLMSKEQEVIESLTDMVQEEVAEVESSQNECDKVMSSVDSTMALFDTLTNSGPFNAMHVLRTMEEQVANFSRLSIKLDQEAKADKLSFQPPQNDLEDQLASWDFGSIVAEFGRGEVSVAGSALTDAEGGDAVACGTSGHNLGDSEANCDVKDKEQDLKSSSKERLSTFNSPSAPPLENSALADPWNAWRTLPRSSPSAPPAPSVPPSSALVMDEMSPAQAAAYSRSIHQDQEFECKILKTFVGNLASDRSNRGGFCGASNIYQINRAAFVDRFNHSVKIVDLSCCSVVGVCDLANHEPWDITFKNATVDEKKELIVTSPNTRTLLFIPTVCDFLKVTRHARCPSGYCCIAFLKGDTYAGGVCLPFGEPEVHIVNFAGRILHTISPPAPFKYPRSIYANQEGNILVVSDWTANTITTVDIEGNLISQYGDVTNPKGVAVSTVTGLLHVLDGKKNKIHVLDISGTCIETCKVECRDLRTVVAVPVYTGRFPLQNEVLVVADGFNKLHVLDIFSQDHAVRTEV